MYPAAVVPAFRAVSPAARHLFQLGHTVSAFGNDASRTNAPCNSGNTISGHIDLSEEEQRVLRTGYYGNIAFMDSQIGRILEKAVRIPNTYIIFTSDHGELLGDHYLYQKNRPYEGAVHVPLVIMGPGIPDCSTIDAPVAWRDLTSTILDLAGLPIPSSMDGRSMKTLLLQGADAGWREYLQCVLSI